jgi:low affinity Fe/Cu permease
MNGKLAAQHLRSLLFGKKKGPSKFKLDDEKVMKDWFHKFAHGTADIAGSVWVFILAILVVLVWAAVGPIFGFSDTWQLVINTGTTIVTFLMVFLIQNSQNRDAKSMHLKIDELLRAVAKARTGLINLEELSDEEIKKLQAEFKKLGENSKPSQPNASRRTEKAEKRTT